MEKDSLVKIKDVTHNRRTPLESVLPLEQPYILYIDPCGACNLTCQFCPCNTSDYMKKERHSMMTLETFQKIIDDIKEFPEKIKVLYLFGFGEPLLNKHIFDMIRYAKQSNVADKIRLYTNGVALTTKVSDELVDCGLDSLRISLNGLDSKDYEEICAMKLDYDKFHENMRYFYEKSRGKMDFIIKVANLFLDTKEKQEKLNALYFDICDHIFVEDIYENWSDFDGLTTEEAKRLEAERKKKICTFPLTMMMIHSSGRVSPCCVDWNFSLNYGNIHEDSVKNIWNSKGLRVFSCSLLKKERGVYPVCDHCQVVTPDDVDDVAHLILEKFQR